MNDDRTLLDVYEALTKPHVLTRLTGTDHEHDWLELVRPTTREERDRAKAEKRKPEKTVPTGEWWCPWCETTVAELPAPEDTRSVNRFDDSPLLDQLEERIGTTLGDGGTRGARTGGSPIDVKAFGLAARIRETVEGWVVSLGGRAGKGIPLLRLLTSWYMLRAAGQPTEAEDEQFRVVLEGWRTEILDIIDPPDQIPYRGQECPICGATRAVRSVEGVEEDTVALWAFLRPEYREEGSYGVCKACSNVLAHDRDPLALRRKMNGTLSGRFGLAYQTSTAEPGGTPSNMRPEGDA